MADDVCLYPYSLEEARKRQETELWRESRMANHKCRNAIDAAILRDYDGQSLASSCLQRVVAEYGYKRVNWVLATTIQAKGTDGRFSDESMAWAKCTFIQDIGLEKAPETICVDSQPHAVELFVGQFRDAVQALGMFDRSHCEADSGELDYTGKVLVLSPDILKESCWRPEDQLWYAHDGFGCAPHARGRSIRCECLGDGEQTRWNRHDFIGALKDEHLPDWARARLEQLKYPTQENAPQMGGMTMN